MEILLVHDPERIQKDLAIARALALAIPIVQHGLAPWMEQQGLDYGTDGWLCVVVSDVPRRNAGHEVLAVFSGADITGQNIELVKDFEPDPPDGRELLRRKLQAGQSLTAPELREALGFLL